MKIDESQPIPNYLISQNEIAHHQPFLFSFFIISFQSPCEEQLGKSWMSHIFFITGVS